jgi:hypothetical protein
MGNSKTPKFDALIEPILSALVPHARTCVWKEKHSHCEGEFSITAPDIEFLKQFRVPPPNFCPTCRRMRRLVHMNMVRLFKRPCDAPGHSETMISILPEECPFPVYDYQYLASDAFDPFSYGVQYEAGKSPFEVLTRLRKKFPMPSFLNRDPSSINSDYTNGGRNNKNCYFAMACYDAEDVWYSQMVNKSKAIMDSRIIVDSDHVYEAVSSFRLFRVLYSYFSKDCTTSMFLFDCRNCTDCFGCVNLRNKKYCVFNEQLSKEEYEAFMLALSPRRRSKLKEYEEKFWQLVRSAPLAASRNVSAENCVGVNIERAKEVYDGSEVYDASQLRHVDFCYTHSGSMDLLFSGNNSSNLYMTTNIGSQSSNVKFSISSKFSTESEFIFNSKRLSNCFMCFGLADKSYCVLNVQYEPEEYFALVDMLKAEMLSRGEYGDGLGFEFSGQAYNFSLGQISYPLSEAEIKNLGGFSAKEPETNVGSMSVIDSELVPETIEEVTDEILQKAIRCEVTGRPFRITETELVFYRNMQIPLPTVHPVIRMEGHFKLSLPAKKYVASCVQCGVTTPSVFNPEEFNNLYCESCFRQEVV